MSELLKLAARVEALEGPDREVDAKIARAVGRIPQAAAYEGTVKMGDLAWLNGFCYEIPPYTASLDAAMPLVPDGMGVSLQRYWIASRHNAVWSAEMSTGGTPDRPRQVFDCFDALNPALALTAAALCARASQQ